MSKKHTKKETKIYIENSGCAKRCCTQCPENNCPSFSEKNKLMIYFLLLTVGPILLFYLFTTSIEVNKRYHMELMNRPVVESTVNHEATTIE